MNMHRVLHGALRYQGNVTISKMHWLSLASAGIGRAGGGGTEPSRVGEGRQRVSWEREGGEKEVG